ncbi:hypothetical protein HELRODRAFT_68122, partial [Helobdella robusta]|uniref:RING-type domain-containing protein n=1 Tax=Helobdella robusta TaxID=6412 RepID=T1FZA5_HELRO
MDPIKKLSDDEQYFLVIDLQNIFYAQLSSYKLTVDYPFTVEHFDGVISHRDTFYRDLPNSRSYILPYFENKFITSTCAICLDTFVKGAYVHKLHCGHPYHERCIQKWKKQRTTCPTCR